MRGGGFILGVDSQITDDIDWQEYMDNHSGLGRTELFRANSNLYRRLLEKDFVKHIPRKKQSEERHLQILESGFYDKSVKGEIRREDFAHYIWLWRNNLIRLYPKNRIAA